MDEDPGVRGKHAFASVAPFGAWEMNLLVLRIGRLATITEECTRAIAYHDQVILDREGLLAITASEMQLRLMVHKKLFAAEVQSAQMAHPVSGGVTKMCVEVGWRFKENLALLAPFVFVIFATMAMQAPFRTAHGIAHEAHILVATRIPAGPIRARHFAMLSRCGYLW